MASGLAVALLLALAGSAEAQTTDRIGYWSFDEGSGSVANDGSGHDNDGMIHGATWTTDSISGGQALSFDGNGHVEIPPSSDFYYDRGYTFSLWFKASTVDAYQGQMGQHSGRQYINFYLNLDRLRWETDAGQAFYANTRIEAGKWYHIVGTYDFSTRLAQLYVYGRLENQAILTSDKNFSNIPLAIGSYSVGYFPFNGVVDEVSLYNRALSPEEIMELYEAGARDSDSDGIDDAFDNCTDVPNPDQADTDGSGTGDACNSASDPDDDEWEDGHDNCPSTPNPDQADGDGDGDGDACQPTVEIAAIANGGPGGALRVEADLGDPNGDPLSGTVAIATAGADPVDLPSDRSGSVGGLSFCYAMGSYLMSPDWGYCYDGGWDRVYFAADWSEVQDCETWQASGKYLRRDYVSIDELSWLYQFPIKLCVVDAYDMDRFADLVITGWSPGGTLTYSGGSEIILEEPYADALPDSLPLGALAGREGEELKLAITATDGNTSPASDRESFTYQGEDTLVFPGDEEVLPPGREEPSAGFSKGEKAGWDGDLPPGFDKGKKKGWEK
ncbi:MAG: LamG-like jellyroll fold domain-containing protein [Elusimicrobiota bacterium]